METLKILILFLFESIGDLELIKYLVEKNEAGIINSTLGTTKRR